jgi:hypothetical protein
VLIAAASLRDPGFAQLHDIGARIRRIVLKEIRHLPGINQARAGEADAAYDLLLSDRHIEAAGARNIGSGREALCCADRNTAATTECGALVDLKPLLNAVYATSQDAMIAAMNVSLRLVLAP